MNNVTAVPLREPHSVARAYTKRLRLVNQLQFFVPLVGIEVYGYLRLGEWFALSAKAVTGNFYLQIALCWFPVWAIYAAGSILISRYRLHIDRKFQLSNSSFRAWLSDSLKANGLGFAVGFGIVEIAFASQRVSPSWGWVLAGMLCSLLFLGLNRLLPWLLSMFYPVLPLSDTSLREQLTRLAKKAGVPIANIYEWRVSSRTRKANALVAGIGTTRRILLTDTLVSELTGDELEAIVGHELGHCALHHIRNRVLLQSTVFCAIFWVINAAVRNALVQFAGANTGWDDLGLIPGFFLVWSFAYIYGNLILAALARRQERDADFYCWKLVGRVEPFITAMQKLINLNLVVYDKSSQWKYSHPATADRIAAAQRYANALYQA